MWEKGWRCGAMEFCGHVVFISYHPRMRMFPRTIQEISWSDLSFCSQSVATQIHTSGTIDTKSSTSYFLELIFGRLP